MAPEGLGLPNSTRQAEATALTGFQLAMVCSHEGMPCVGTKTFDTKASGKMTMKTMPCADSAPETTMPRQAFIQVSA